MAIRGRSYINYPLVRPLNLTLHKAGQVTISASTAFTVTGAKNGQGTTTLSATAALTGSGTKTGQGSATISAATSDVTASGTKGGSGTATLGATGAITGSGMAASDFDVIIGRPYVITIGPPREVIP